MVGSHLPFAGPMRLQTAHGLSPLMDISLPGAGALQKDGQFCSCGKILSLSQNTWCKSSLSFCPGRGLVWWEWAPVRKEWGKDHFYFLHWRILRILLIPRHLINSPTERALENVHTIYQFWGNWKQKICLFSFASLLSLLHLSSRPPVLPSSLREGKVSGAGKGGGGQPSAFSNPMTGFIVSFQQKIGTFQQMEIFFWWRCYFLSKTFFSRKHFKWLEFWLFLAWKT